MMPRYSLISSNFIRLLRDVILEINKERNRCCPVVAGGFGRLWRRRAYYVRRLCCFLPLALILFICIDVGTKDGCSGLLGPNLEQPDT
ncbi:hypothetical protein HanLR1_Chr17g0666431 [Helianthus annuus]|nr:hypothetical protein HanHA89_Chr17g0707781 [Helianthus annuus]KAJ0632559.1 hypothetical protein HanLR1_Chr17g0666431 [Helianthus annuus]